MSKITILDYCIHYTLRVLNIRTCKSLWALAETKDKKISSLLLKEGYIVILRYMIQNVIVYFPLFRTNQLQISSRSKEGRLAMVQYCSQVSQQQV